MALSEPSSSSSSSSGSRLKELTANISEVDEKVNIFADWWLVKKDSCASIINKEKIAKIIIGLFLHSRSFQLCHNGQLLNVFQSNLTDWANGLELVYSKRGVTYMLKTVKRTGHNYRYRFSEEIKNKDKKTKNKVPWVSKSLGYVEYNESEISNDVVAACAMVRTFINKVPVALFDNPWDAGVADDDNDTDDTDEDTDADILNNTSSEVINLSNDEYSPS